MAALHRDGFLNGSHPALTLIVPTPTGTLALSLAMTLREFRGESSTPDTNVLPRLIAVLPEHVGHERISLLKALAVDIVRTPDHVHRDAPESMRGMARRLKRELRNGSVLVIDDVDEEVDGDGADVDQFIRDAMRNAYHELAEEIRSQMKALVPHVTAVALPLTSTSLLDAMQLVLGKTLTVLGVTSSVAENAIHGSKVGHGMPAQSALHHCMHFFRRTALHASALDTDRRTATFDSQTSS